VSDVDAVVLDDLIRHRVRTTPDTAAILHGDRSITYGELAEDVDRAARMLGGLGIGRGDRVGLMFPNRPEMVVLYFACFRMGAVVVPVNTRYKRDEIEYALDHSEARLLLVDQRFLEAVDGLDAQVGSLERILVLDGDPGADDQLHVHLANAPAELETPQVEPHDPAVILYTSGSTSRPKGVTHSHFSLLGCARIQAATREIRADTVWLVSTGVGYIAGLAGVTLPAFRTGCTLVLVTELTPDNLLRAIDRHRADITLLLPTMLLEMLDSPLADTLDLSSLTSCFVAGDECTPDLYERFRGRMGRDLLQAFGMTECEGYLSNRPSGPSRNHTVGVPASRARVSLAKIAPPPSATTPISVAIA
jgi:acyl-CoA synthetase (AMP-forming)/AMP-acid ligase II